MHLAWRWFTGFGFRSGDSASLHVLEEPARTASGIEAVRELFEQIVLQCVEVGLAQGKHLPVDSSFVEANAAKESRIPRELLARELSLNTNKGEFAIVGKPESDGIQLRFCDVITITICSCKNPLLK
jgi:hypothetical protein